MLHIVEFVDAPGHEETRDRLMADHLTFLERNAKAIRAAGPLFDPGDGSGAGGLWIVEADDASTVRALVEADPFWPTGLRAAVRVRRWHQVFSEGERLI